MRASYESGGGGGINWAFLLTGIFAVLVAGGFGYYYWQTTRTMSERNLTIATQQAQLTGLNTQVTGLQTELTTERDTSASLTSQLSSTQGQLAQANTQLAQKNAELTASQSQTSTFQSQITTLTNEKNTLQAQVDNLTSIVNLSASTTQASAVSVSQSAGALSTVTSFNATYAGYLVISGTHSASSGYIRVYDSFSYYPAVLNNYEYSLVSGGSVYVPVLPGSITVSFGNHDGGTSTPYASLSVVYYY